MLHLHSKQNFSALLLTARVAITELQGYDFVLRHEDHSIVKRDFHCAKAPSFLAYLELKLSQCVTRENIGFWKYRMPRIFEVFLN